MSKENPIVITRGYHVPEFSAFRLARQTADELTRRGHKVNLLTFPVERTEWGRAFRKDFVEDLLGHKELVKLFGLDPGKVFFHDFHNYQIPENRRSFQIGRVDKENNWTDQDLDGRLGIGLCQDFDWYDDKEIMPINMAVYEIPALWEPIPPRILEKMGDRFFTSSPQQYRNRMVDHNSTKRAELMSEKMIELLVQSVLRIHRYFPVPIEIDPDLCKF